MKNFRSAFLRLGLSVLALGLPLWGVSQQARAEGTFISAPSRTDFVHDTARGKIYISSGNQLLRYDIATGTTTPWNEVGGIAGQLDLSPDGNLLAIAITPTPGTTLTARAPFALVDLTTFQRRFVASSVNNLYGAASVAFDNAGALLVVPKLQYGTGTPYRYFTDTAGTINYPGKEIETLPYYALSNPLLVPAPDREKIGFAERNSDGGGWGFFDVPTGTFSSPPSRVQNGTNGFNYALGISSDTGQFALPSYTGLKIFNPSGSLLSTLGVPGASTGVANTGMGLAYNPKASRFYAPWSGTNQVRVFDATTFSQIGAYDFETTFDWQNAQSFAKGHTRVSDNGQLLMASVDGGVRFVTLETPASIRPLKFVGQTLFLDEDKTATVRIKWSGGYASYGPTATLTTQPQNGTLTMNSGSLSWTYRPSANFNGVDRARFTISQGELAPVSGWVYFKIAPVNDAPVLTLTEPNARRVRKNGLAVARGYTASDVDGTTTFSYRVVTPPQNGTATYNSWDGGFLYRANADFVGADSFQIVANDGTGAPGLDSNAITIPILVLDNAAPVARNDEFFNVNLNQSFTVPAPGLLSNDSDADGDALTAVGSGFISWGSATVSPDGSLRYDPWIGQFAPDSTIRVTYYVKDALGASNTATVTLYSGPPTVATPQTVSTNKNTPLAITLGATGEAPFTYGYAQPAHGTLSGTAPNLTYTPTANYVGNDEISFSAKSSNGSFGSAKITISVVQTNAAPTASDQNVSGSEDENIAVTLGASDPDGDALTYTVTAQPAHGTLSGTAPNLVYRAFDDYNGSDSFAYKVSDSEFEKSATVSITVAPVSDRPLAGNDAYEGSEDAVLSVAAPGLLANDSDADGEALSITVKTQPAHGAVQIGQGGAFSYTPDTDWNGSDSFTYAVSDGVLESATATVSLQIAAVDDAPIARADTLTGALEDELFFLSDDDLLGNDSDPDGALVNPEIEIVTQPEYGSLAATVGGYDYLPFFDWNGTDSFTYRVKNGDLWSQELSVSIEVAPVNDAPLDGEFSNLKATEDTPARFPLGGVDPDGDTLVYAVQTAPGHGTAAIEGGEVVYMPGSNFNGSDSFVLTATDPDGESGLLSFGIQVAPVNDAPIANAQVVSGVEDTPKLFALSGSDVDGDALSFTLVSPPANGVLSGTAPNLTFTPNENWNGTTTLQFRVSDGTLSSELASATLNFAPVNDAPVAQNATANGFEDTALSISLGASDAEGDALTFAIVGSPTKGTLAQNGSTLVYTPNANQNGSDSFSFRAFDSQVWSNTATVFLQIAPVNDAPIANAQSVSTAFNTAKAITLTGSDVDGETLTWSIVANPTRGTLSGTGANRTYTPQSGLSGSDSFTFRVFDGAAWSNTATVSITVQAPVSAPVAQARTATTLEDQVATVPLSGTAFNGASIDTWSIVSNPTWGALEGGGNARTYRPLANYFGNDSFTYRVRDNRGVWSEPATVSLAVTPVNDAPTFNLVGSVSASKNAPTQTIANVASAISTGSQYETDQTLTFVIQANSNSGLFSTQPSLAPDGTLTFKSANGKTGSATIQVALRDSGGTANNGQNQSQSKNFTIQIR